MRQTNRETQARSAARRLREDQAPRLKDEVRRLTSLHIDVENGPNRYLWRIVVERAPALFEIACPEPGCTNGGHDITRSVMHALRTSAVRFEGEDVCHGELALGACGRVLKFTAHATYGP